MRFQLLREKLEKKIEETTNSLQETISNKEKMASNFDDTEKLYLDRIRLLQEDVDSTKALVNELSEK